MNSIKLNTRGKKQLGQGMTEYIIIVALVAIAAIGVYSAFGDTLQHNVAAITQSVAGQSAAATSEVGLAKTEAGKTTTDAGKAVGMDTFEQNVVDQ
jgi:Flp pilus assembly pilin Flp